MYLYMSLYQYPYHYPLTHRSIRRERVCCNRERRWELQSSATLRAELREVAIHHNLVVLRMRGFVLPETR